MKSRSMLGLTVCFEMFLESENLSSKAKQMPWLWARNSYLPNCNRLNFQKLRFRWEKDGFISTFEIMEGV